MDDRYISRIGRSATNAHSNIIDNIVLYEKSLANAQFVEVPQQQQHYQHISGSSTSLFDS